MTNYHTNTVFHIRFSPYNLSLQIIRRTEKEPGNQHIQQKSCEEQNAAGNHSLKKDCTRQFSVVGNSPECLQKQHGNDSEYI